MSNTSVSELFPWTFLKESSLHESLSEEFSLCENDNMVFHWADFHETCDAIKDRIVNDPELKEDFHRKEIAINRMALIPVWIKTEKKVHQTSMYELYERYILNLTQFAVGINPLSAIEISFIAGSGPFRSLAIAECFNKQTYKDFVMVFLLQGKLPRRDFRIRLKSKVLMEYGKEFTKGHLIQLEQLTMNGLLLSLDSDFFSKEIAKEESLRILVDSESLLSCLKMDLNEMKGHLSQFAFNLMYSSKKEDAIVCRMSSFNVQSSFDFLRSKKVFLFISYQDIQSEGKSAAGDIKKFVTHTRELIRAYYQSKALEESA